MTVAYHPLRFALHGVFRSRFQKVLQELARADDLASAIEEVSLREYQWATYEISINSQQRRLYRTAWLFLRDIARVGWQFRIHNGNLEVSPPAKTMLNVAQDNSQTKRILRSLMSDARRERIAEAAEFIRRMEAPTDGRVPIHCLIADGKELSAQLRRIRHVPNASRRLELLSQAIQPYLQLVRNGERCPETGHYLSDIWRYFRFTWSTPAEPIPGRALFYLVRDKARPFHPVIGIAALQNAPIRIAARDDYIGWSVDSFIASIRNCRDAHEVRRRIQWLIDCIALAIEDLDISDLCDPAETLNPSDELLDRLLTIAQRAEEQRREALRTWGAQRNNAPANFEHDPETGSLSFQRSSLGNISLEAEEALYRRKRAEQLRRLLLARQVLATLVDRQFTEADYLEALLSERVQVAIRWVLAALKSRHVGTSIMELSVCGAVPPYNEILGGKLVSLLMLSPEVIRDYRERYGNRPSDIASRLKGTEVVRPAELVFLETTSLYNVGSSQYNRLKLPAGLLGEGTPEIRWELIGETTGYGTFHISRLTVQCMEEMLLESGYRNVNHVFGEGSSPKLRVIRQALRHMLGPGQSRLVGILSQHSMSRLVYGAWLAINGRGYLTGLEPKPVHAFDQELPVEEATNRIIDYWRERWLLRRLEHEPALERMERFSKDALLVSRQLPTADSFGYVPIHEEGPSKMTPAPAENDEGIREFVRNLYRGSSLFADGMPDDYLQKIHVETRLDVAILQALEAGKSVVLTGNPGDGKTHLQRRIATAAERLRTSPVVVFDASALTDQELYERWKAALDEGRPFFVAINQAVLFNLAHRYPDFAPLQSAVEQVRKAVFYDQEPSVQGEDRIVVFDLSRRNVLAPEIVSVAIDNLTDERLFSGCHVCPVEGCDVIRHRRLLRDPRFKERLQRLLDRLSRRGYRATLRQLVSLISYLLFAGRDCATLLRTSGNQQFYLSELLFSGKGDLFEALRSSFDPARVSHPVWDERLIDGNTSPEDWVAEWHLETDSMDPQRYDQFVARKRAFYFFHRNGDALLDIAEDDETAFGRLLEHQSEREALRTIIRGLNLFFGNPGSSDHLRIWQRHHYGRTGYRIFYSEGIRHRREFEIVFPKLRNTMASGFDLARDHFLVRLRERPQVSLRVDYALYHVLAQVERGVPPMHMDDEATRRIWRFMEQLARVDSSPTNGETTIVVFDPMAEKKQTVTVDLNEGIYLSIKQGDEF